MTRGRAAAGGRTRLLSLSLAAAFLAVSAVSAVTAQPSEAVTAVGAGCDPSRPALVHGPDDVSATTEKGTRVRVPCGVETGYYTGETTIGVTDAGTVWFSAADWEWALVRSSDDGATWERFAVPGPQAYPGCPGVTSAFTPPCDNSQQGKYNTVADAFLWVDPDTSRIFWTKTYGYALCSSMNMSGDDGETWTAVTTWGCPGGDYEKIAGGPAPEGTPQPEGYPNVLYGCTNGPAPTFVVGPSRVCYRSLDGGLTWDATGVPVTPSPLAPGCLHFQESHKVASDGTLFMPLGCALDTSRVMVAYSTDQATSWSYVQVPVGEVGNDAGLIGGVSVAVDEQDVLYVAWTGLDGRLHLASTSDRGQTWRGPFAASLPGVTSGTPRGQVAAGEAGHVAIAYYGRTDDDPEGVLHGYLTESFDADAETPTFRTARLNAVDDPLYVPTDGGTLPRNDYLGVTIAPDGTPWTALVKLASATPDEEGFVQSTGYAGRLAWVDQPAWAPGADPGGDAAAPAAGPLPATGGGPATAAFLALAGGAIRRRYPRRSHGGHP